MSEWDDIYTDVPASYEPDGGVPAAAPTSDDVSRMPSDLGAERSVLSAMLISADILQDALVELKDDDFYLPRNKTIFTAMREMFDRNLPVDRISLADHLQSHDDLERVGGRSYLADLGSDLLSMAGWRHHAEIMRRDATLRCMIEAASDIQALAFDAPEDTKEVVDSAERMILSVTERDLKGTYSPLSSVMESLYTELGIQAQNPDANMGVMTGYPGIDKMLLGLRSGQMVVVGARPGVGKTSFALNLATNAAAAGASVAFFSLEMSKVEIGQRLLSSATKIDLRDIRSAHIRPEVWPTLLEATNELSKLDIMIDDTPGTTVTEVRAKARRMLHGKENGIVILDYLQLVSPPSGRYRADSRTTEVSEMSRGIKIMAKDIGVPVVALSQLSRATTQRQGKRPELSDLRESGAIEQDADIVILLDRSTTPEEAERDDRPDQGVTSFIIAKNRSGPTGAVDLVFLPGSTKFVEVTRELP